MPSRPMKRAFTIAELLLSLALLAILLAAIGAAVHASIHSYQENDKIATAAQTARSILYRLTKEVRTADAVDTTTSSVSIIPPDTTGVVIEYEFTGGTLYYRRIVNGSPSEHVLLGPSDAAVPTGFVVSRVDGTVTRDVGGVPTVLVCTKQVTVTLSVDAGGEAYTVTASACPRRNQDL